MPLILDGPHAGQYVHLAPPPRCVVLLDGAWDYHQYVLTGTPVGRPRGRRSTGTLYRYAGRLGRAWWAPWAIDFTAKSLGNKAISAQNQGGRRRAKP